MKKIIVADTVREYAVMFAEKGEKATLKAWERQKRLLIMLKLLLLPCV